MFTGSDTVVRENKNGDEVASNARIVTRHILLSPVLIFLSLIYDVLRQGGLFE